MPRMRRARLVLQQGIEPRSDGYEPSALPLSYRSEIGQRSRLRSCDLLRPRQVLYQAELCAVGWRGYGVSIPGLPVDNRTLCL